MTQKAPLKILIRGGGWVNKGGEAMLCTVQDQLSSRLPDAQFFANLPPNPDIYNASKCFSTVPEYSGYEGNRFGKFLHILKVVSKHPLLMKGFFSNSWATIQAINSVEKVDALLDISGYAYSDDWGSIYASRTWIYSYYANRLKKPYIFLPQAWGPFKMRPVARLTKDLIRWSPFVFVRDHQSMSHIKQLFGELNGKVRLTPDIAFLFKATPYQIDIKQVRKICGGKEETPIIGVVPNMRIYERMSGRGKESLYVGLLIKIIRWAVLQGASVLLIPHEISFSKDSQDDRFLCQLIMEQVKDSGCVSALDGMYSAIELKSYIACLDIVVGSRYHSIIAALSCGVPAVVLGWSHKYKELMQTFGLEEFVLDYNQTQETLLINRIDTAWKKRNKLKYQIYSKLSYIERDVHDCFNSTAELIRGSIQNP